MKVENQTHELQFLDGPLEGSAFHLTGVVPFLQFQIGGTMDEPIFHLYALDQGQKVQEGTVVYKFQRTYTFEELASIIPPIK